MSSPDQNLTPKQSLTLEVKRLRDLHAKPVLASVLADGDAAPEGVKPFFATIAENLFEGDFNVNKLWKECGVRNRSAASKELTQTVNESPGKYIRRHRCAAAVALLRQTRLKIWKISHAVGYFDANALCRAFKQTYNQKPSDFRKKTGAWTPDQAPEPALSLPAVRSGGKIRPERYDDELRRISQDRLEVLDKRIDGLASKLAASAHLRGAERAALGNVDGGYDDLVLARRCDAAAGETAAPGQRRVLLSCDTEAFFVRALCPDCRRTFQGDAGADVRRHMRQALALVPRSLAWFDHCCDDCYRLVWAAVDRARLGLLEDAFQAWWISEHADDGHASRGLFIRLLFDSEKLAHRKPRRRPELCRRARDVARELGLVDLENLARIYEGNALRAISEFQEARGVFGGVDTRSCLWLRAFYLHRRGTLDTDDQELEAAIDRLRRGAALLQELDPHTAGLVRMKLAEALKWQGQFQEALTLFEGTLPDLDLRRWPTAGDFVEISHALHLIACGEYDRAESCLACDLQYSLWSPNFTATSGELRLAQGETQWARRLLEDAIAGFLERDKFNDAIPLILEVAETHALEGSLNQAIESAMAALTYGVSETRPKQILQAIAQLGDYSGSAAELAKVFRELAWQCGGGLPPRSSED